MNATNKFRLVIAGAACFLFAGIALAWFSFETEAYVKWISGLLLCVLSAVVAGYGFLMMVIEAENEKTYLDLKKKGRIDLEPQKGPIGVIYLPRSRKTFPPSAPT